MQNEEFYQNLRVCSLAEDIAKAYPRWPYPLLFHDIEISRDIFILDQAIDRGGLELGGNPIHDLTSEQRPELGYWFHYEFFNLWGAAQRSVEAIALQARLSALKKGLFEALPGSEFTDFLSRQLSVPDPDHVIALFMSEVTRMIEVSARCDIVVLGIRTCDEDARKQQDCLAALAQVRTDLLFELPHMKSAIRKWESILKVEDKEMRKAEAKLNKFYKAPDADLEQKLHRVRRKLH